MEQTESYLAAQDLNQQAKALFKAGNVEAAIQKINDAINEEPMLIDNYKNLGDINIKLGNYKEAKNYYKKALLIEKDGEIYFQYGNACFLNDEPHEGLEYYNRAMSAGFDSDEMFFFMGMAYEHMNDDRMALRYVQKALNKNPSRPDYKVKKISILLRLDMVDEAKEEIDQLILNDPELFDGYHIKNMLLINEQNYEEAVKASKLAVDKFPEDVDLMYDYINAITLSGKLDEALQLLNNARKMTYFEEAKARFLVLDAQINAEMGKTEEAIAKCYECLALETDEMKFPEIRFMLLNLHLIKPSFDLALEQAEGLIKDRETEDANRSYYYAALYFRPFCMKKMGRDEDAKECYEEAVSLFRMFTLQNPEAYDAYLYRIMCLKDMEKYDEALDLLEFMENLSNEIAEIYTIRADIYKITGKENLMKEALERAYELKPELKGALGEAGE